MHKLRQHCLGLACILLLFTGCATPVAEERADGLSPDQAATLSSLEQVDDYPLYILYYHGAYEGAASAGDVLPQVQSWPAAPLPWACSLFAALAAAESGVYGRNFDWQYSPAVLLFTDPPDGYASVSMVDIAYLFEADQTKTLMDLALAERGPLLYAPSLPFDGMNEHGLAIGMAAVPGQPMPHDPEEETIDSLAIIREMLDHARDVDEALAIMESYNLRWGSGPPLHYLLADVSGRALLVEFYDGEMVVVPNEAPWHLATNFLRSQADETGSYACWRYDRVQERLAETGGQLTGQEALDLLSDVAQPGSTQWSVVYDMSAGEVRVAMGRKYGDVHTFQLGRAGE
jgi:hypothetical protein